MFESRIHFPLKLWPSPPVLHTVTVGAHVLLVIAAILRCLGKHFGLVEEQHKTRIGALRVL